MVTKEQWRTDRYADAIYDLAVDHPMWIGDDGQPLDYLPARETRIADFVYQAAAAVMAKADAELAALRAELEYPDLAYAVQKGGPNLDGPTVLTDEPTGDAMRWTKDDD